MSKIGSTFCPGCRCRALYEKQPKVNERRGEQSPCGRPRSSQYEFQPEVQEPETQQCSRAVNNGRLPCRKLHNADGDQSQEGQQGFQRSRKEFSHCLWARPDNLRGRSLRGTSMRLPRNAGTATGRRWRTGCMPRYESARCSAKPWTVSMTRLIGKGRIPRRVPEA